MEIKKDCIKFPGGIPEEGFNLDFRVKFTPINTINTSKCYIDEPISSIGEMDTRAYMKERAYREVIQTFMEFVKKNPWTCAFPLIEEEWSSIIIGERQVRRIKVELQICKVIQDGDYEIPNYLYNLYKNKGGV